MTAVILLIHDDPLALAFVRHVLEVQGGHVVVPASDSATALIALHQHDAALVPDLIITGSRQHATVMGSTLRGAQRDSRRLPVLVLDEVEGLAITPAAHRVAPDPRELLLKLKALLRSGPADETVIEHGGLRLDPVQQQAYAGHVPLNLTALGFRLLHLLLANPGRVFSRAHLLQAVWAGQGFVEERTVDVHVYRLRNQLARFGYGHLIEAVRGSGYRCATDQPRRPATAAGLRFAP